MLESLKKWLGLTPSELPRSVDDDVLGTITFDEDKDAFLATVQSEGQVLRFLLDGDSTPAPSLVAHAREIVHDSEAFMERVRVFLDAESSRFPGLEAEVRGLKLESYCLMWADRHDDGMLYFDGGREGRPWRCDAPLTARIRFVIALPPQ